MIRLIGFMTLFVFIASCSGQKILIKNIENIRIGWPVGVIPGYEDILLETDSCLYDLKSKTFYLKCKAMVYTNHETFPPEFCHVVIKRGELFDTVLSTQANGYLEGKFRLNPNDTIGIVAPTFNGNYYSLSKKINTSNLE